MSPTCGQSSSCEALSTNTHPFRFLDFGPPTFLKNPQRPLKRGDRAGSRNEPLSFGRFVKLVAKTVLRPADGSWTHIKYW